MVAGRKQYNIKPKNRGNVVKGEKSGTTSRTCLQLDVAFDSLPVALIHPFAETWVRFAVLRYSHRRAYVNEQQNLIAIDLVRKLIVDCSMTGRPMSLPNPLANFGGD
ncbi:hypothetical protein CEP54_005783 [Fusarium duplospermum]|uniref:Uncharacterized protein n=1 Tax=Fusarium duplospermum TaxID=1325734 RepID=A0A428QAL7_9HYPO|nr:hypothetical protein CEP54_005783 [Fusarium duplospermum]